MCSCVWSPRRYSKWLAQWHLDIIRLGRECYTLTLTTLISWLITRVQTSRHKPNSLTLWSPSTSEESATETDMETWCKSLENMKQTKLSKPESQQDIKGYDVWLTVSVWIHWFSAHPSMKGHLSSVWKSQDKATWKYQSPGQSNVTIDTSLKGGSSWHFTLFCIEHKHCLFFSKRVPVTWNRINSPVLQIWACWDGSNKLHPTSSSCSPLATPPSSCPNLMI